MKDFDKHCNTLPIPTTVSASCGSNCMSIETGPNGNPLCNNYWTRSLIPIGSPIIARDFKTDNEKRPLKLSQTDEISLGLQENYWRKDIAHVLGQL